ncbi:von Willebrand factor type A domain-containing protein [Mycena filopes]|nr:von Willebrand factor type A domain-containing protein [Mycena filopes]
MSRNSTWGLYYSSNNRIVPLPLLQVHAAADIKELAAGVKLTQTYLNDTDGAHEVGYSFPIPARAVVCSFAMIKQDGTRVVGLVQEKQEARETYDAAVSQGKTAALVEQQTPDVFQIAVGNIQPQETVVIELLYATVLAEDEDNDSIRFHLPLHIGARYGQPPPSSPPDNAGHSNAFLEILVNVETLAPIAKIGCPSHTVLTELGPNPALPNAHELPFSNYARVSLSSAAALDKDFVLTVKSGGLDAPRCVAEPDPAHRTTALAFTLVPRFKLPDVSRQEFIFLVDRSGSMDGLRILAARRALIVMMRSLPVKDSFFQIASFGSTCTTLWEEGSRPYHQGTLDEATQHVDTMQSDYGGTQIREALAHCFARRKTDRPTSVFVLTDGAAWNVDDVLTEVKTSLASCTAQAYLRVSVLGIGNSASTAMCEGIARVGNGTCMMVGEEETTFTGKIARMLKAARTPMITDIAVDWGIPAPEEISTEEDDEAFVVVPRVEEERSENATLNVFAESVDPLHTDDQAVPPSPPVVLSPSPPVQQSPFNIRSLSPGNRFSVYAILQGKSVPKVVTLTGLTEDGSKVQLSVPVTLSNLPTAAHSPLPIHALAARKIIQDIEDGQHAILTSNPEDADLLRRTVKAHIVRLAKLYSIVSSHTSFVAVDQSSVPPTNDTVPVSRSVSTSAAQTPSSDRAAQIEQKKAKLAQMRQSRVQRQLHTPPPPTEHAAPLGASPSAGSSLTASLTSMPDGPRASMAEVGNASAPLDSLLSRLSAQPVQSGGRDQLALLMNQLSTDPQAQFALTSSVSSSAGKRTRSMRGSPRVGGALPVPSPPPSVDILETLARHQSFDGRFTQDVLSTIPLNLTPHEARAALGVSDDVFATLVAMAFLCSRLAADVEADAWEAMYDKARAFVEDALREISDGLGVDELQARALGYLV